MIHVLAHAAALPVLQAALGLGLALGGGTACTDGRPGAVPPPPAVTAVRGAVDEADREAVAAETPAVPPRAADDPAATGPEPPAGDEPPAAGEQPPADDGPPAASDEEAAPPPAVRVLERLAEATADLRTFSAGLLWAELDEQFESVVTRRGTIAWRVGEDGVRTVGAFIDARIEGQLGASRARRFEQKRDWILQGRWLVERQWLRTPPEFLKRAIAAPGEMQDPFRLDDGLLPLPVGRPAAEILERFEVFDGSIPGEGPLAGLDPARVAAVRLVPRAGTARAEELREVTLLVDRATALPVGVDLRQSGGTRTWVRLDEPRANEPLPGDLGDRLSVEPPPAGSDWRVVIE